jgi:2-phosphosulfolactate phosphatase
MYYDQGSFDIRCEWGMEGLQELLPVSRAVVIVDVLSFTTCVEIAAGKGALVYPYRSRDHSATAYARSRNALMANATREFEGGGYSLSPSSLVDIPAGTALVLPSPNGSTLSLSTGDTPTFAGCLRNATALSSALGQFETGISIIPAGERWKKQQTLRPAIEDLIGAGAVIHALEGTRSPEAETAAAVFAAFRDDLASVLLASGSGRELIGRDFEEDVRLAAALDVSRCVPVLKDGAYRSYHAPGNTGT